MKQLGRDQKIFGDGSFAKVEPGKCPKGGEQIRGGSLLFKHRKVQRFAGRRSQVTWMGPLTTDVFVQAKGIAKKWVNVAGAFIVKIQHRDQPFGGGACSRQVAVKKLFQFY